MQPNKFSNCGYIWFQQTSRSSWTSVIMRSWNLSRDLILTVIESCQLIWFVNRRFDLKHAFWFGFDLNFAWFDVRFYQIADLSLTKVVHSEVLFSISFTRKLLAYTRVYTVIAYSLTGWLWTQRLVWPSTVNAEAQLIIAHCTCPDVCCVWMVSYSGR